MKELSIVGKDYHTDEHAVRYHNLAHGTADEVAKAKDIIESTRPAEVARHAAERAQRAAVSAR
jgi:hypothetical protein